VTVCSVLRFEMIYNLVPFQFTFFFKKRIYIYIYEFCYDIFGVTERYLKVPKVFFNLSR
jgi:hypothetical protein